MQSDHLAPGAESAISPGVRLRRAREARGESVHEAAFAIKLSPRQIEALENDDFAALPGMAFVRGFARNYARYLGLDAAPLLDGIERLAGAELAGALAWALAPAEGGFATGLPAAAAGALVSAGASGASAGAATGSLLAEAALSRSVGAGAKAGAGSVCSSSAAGGSVRNQSKYQPTPSSTSSTATTAPAGKLPRRPPPPDGRSPSALRIGDRSG